MLRYEEQKFLEITVQDGSNTAKKQALQRLCQLWRRGIRPSSPEQIKALVLYSLGSSDAKVKRWAFNALALLGDKRDVPVMTMYWRDSFEDHDVFEAGLTALAQILSKPELLQLLSDSGVALSPNVIMALAQLPGDYDEELAGLSLRIENADVRELRSATLLIGLQRAPEKLFSDKYPVSSVIGELNNHNDNIVSQYSFWATVENSDLDLSSVKMPPALFSQLPQNVQAWAYRVLTKDKLTAKKHYDLIVEGSDSDYAEVREGVAMGLRDIFYDSLDTLIIDWSLSEDDLAIREKLWEHMSVHAGQSPGYREEVERAYRTSSINSNLRARLEAACQDQGLSLSLRKIALQTGDPDLFTQIVGANVTHNNQVFNGAVQGASIMQTNSGSVTVTMEQQKQALSTVEGSLKELSSTLQRLPDSVEKSSISSAVDDALKKPSKSTVGKVLDWLKSAKEGLTSITEITDKAGSLYHEIAPLLEELPDMIA